MLNRGLLPPRGRPEAPLDYALSLEGVAWGNQVTLLPGGAEAFPAMLAAIQVAEDEVLLESYILADDFTGGAFLDALAAAARRGCAVRLICDGVGSFRLSQSRLDALEADGVQTLIYRPIAPWRPRWGLWRRDHRKLLVVDGEIGFLGGLNIADEYDDRRGGPPWRDLHMRVEGPSAEALRRVFLLTWNTEAEAGRRTPTVVPSVFASRSDDARSDGPSAGGCAVQVVGNTGFRHRSYLRRAFLYALKRAQKSVYIANPYFIPDRPVARALRRAARRGVDVRVVIPKRSDILICDLASRAALPSLLKDGVRVAQWERGMMHAKAASVDGLWATVGSYNLDRRSFSYNREVTANLLDITVAAEVEERLLSDFNASAEIDLAYFARRPWYLKAVQAIAYRLRSLL